jgi:hypothetical protein
MISSPFVEFPVSCSGHTGEAKQGARLPRLKLCIYGGSGEIFSSYFAKGFGAETVTQRGDTVEAEERAAAGRRLCPEAVTEQKAGYKRKTPSGPKISSESRRMKFANIAGFHEPCDDFASDSGLNCAD